MAKTWVVIGHVTGVWWVDTTKERNGDYASIAHAMYSDPEKLIIESPRSKYLKEVRESHAAWAQASQARKGE